MILSERYTVTDLALQMLAMPYIAFFTFSIPGMILAFVYPEKVSRGRRFFYCSVEVDPL